MNKGLETLDKLKNIKTLSIPERQVIPFDIEYKKEFDIIEQELKEKEKQDRAIKDLMASHIEFVVEKDVAYFKIKNSKGKEKSFTSYAFIDFWKEGLGLDKKKIKDLTLEEKQNICKSQCTCYGCRLSTIKGDSVLCCEDLEREVKLDGVQIVRNSME